MLNPLSAEVGPLVLPEPGMEMDALLAEHLFGWEVEWRYCRWLHDDAFWTEVQQGYEERGILERERARRSPEDLMLRPCRRWSHTLASGETDVHYDPVPEFSTDFASAWKLALEMKQRGYSVELTTDFACRIWQDFDGDHHWTLSAHEGAEDPAHALARATLTALWEESRTGGN